MTLAEVAELPPAAAAVLYRSADLVTAGVQELREGRPLSRGGTALTGPRPLTVGPRPSHPHEHSVTATAATGTTRRPGSSGSGAVRPQTAELRRPGTGSGRPGSASSGSGLTGAMALLASAGMLDGGGGTAAAAAPSPNPGLPPRPMTGSAAGVSGGRADTDAGLHAAGSAAGGGTTGGAGGLVSMAPLTFPLAAGVRGMLRGASGRNGGAAAASCAAHSAGGGSGSGAGSSTGAALAGPGRGTGTAVAHEGDDMHRPASRGTDGSATAPAEECSSAAADPDVEAEVALDVVRKLLGGRNPELLRALDATVFGEEGEEVEVVHNGDSGGERDPGKAGREGPGEAG